MTDTIKRAAFYTPKGGIGKTTSTGHVAADAAIEHDLDVLTIDLAGTQNDLATQFGVTLRPTKKVTSIRTHRSQRSSVRTGTSSGRTSTISSTGWSSRPTRGRISCPLIPASVALTTISRTSRLKTGMIGSRRSSPRRSLGLRDVPQSRRRCDGDQWRVGARPPISSGDRRTRYRLTSSP